VYALLDIRKMFKLRWIKWLGDVVLMGKKRNVCSGFVGKPEEKR
jgi:hypothetical protein